MSVIDGINLIEEQIVGSILSACRRANARREWLKEVADQIRAEVDIPGIGEAVMPMLESNAELMRYFDEGKTPRAAFAEFKYWAFERHDSGEAAR